MPPRAPKSRVAASDPAPWPPQRFEDIAADFAFLDEWEDRYRYVIDLGRAMPPMDEALKVPATKVEGCASQVWIEPRIDGEGGGARASTSPGDSDAMIVRGLIAVLHALYAGLQPGGGAWRSTRRPSSAGSGSTSTCRRSARTGCASMVGRIRAIAQSALEQA